MDLSNHELLRTQVYEYLRSQLREGSLKPGMFLSINHIVKQVGISRTPLILTLFPILKGERRWLRNRNDYYVYAFGEQNILLN